MIDPVGYVFGYATLADARDGLVARTLGSRDAVYGHLRGFRRRWNLAMENRAPLNDHKHYVDPTTGDRPDICVVALNVDEGEGAVNGLALAVTAAELPVFDRRELHYDRIDVSACFSRPLELPVWTYTANDLARREYLAARAAGRAFIRRSYHDHVLEVFRSLGAEAWEDFQRSTDPPEVPLRELEHVSIDAHGERVPARDEPLAPP